MSLSTIRRWLAPYLAWRSRQKRYAAIPGLRDIDVEIVACRRLHKSVRPLERRRQDLIHGHMARELSAFDPRSLEA